MVLVGLTNPSKMNSETLQLSPSFSVSQLGKRIRVFFKKPIKDQKLQLYLLVYFGYRRGNYLVWRGSDLVGLDVWLDDWLSLIKNGSFTAKKKPSPKP